MRHRTNAMVICAVRNSGTSHLLDQADFNQRLLQYVHLLPGHVQRRIACVIASTWSSLAPFGKAAHFSIKSVTQGARSGWGRYYISGAAGSASRSS